ncbi:MAG: sulfatase-like hydrolase/transferase [Myxococcales bacterium]|nr:sulfatase-like hydrolase/transferase [Myxococcales bacterium]
MKRLASSAVWISLVLAVLLNLRQVGYLAVPQNRYMLHWRSLDAGVMILAILASAGVVFAVHEGLDRLPRGLGRRWRSPWLTAVALTGGIATASYLDVSSDVLFWIWLAGLMGLVLPAAFFDAKIHASWIRAGAVFAPVALVTFAQIAWWESWVDGPEELVAPIERDADAVPVYVFLFDEWSVPESVRGAAFRPELEHLNALARTSITFRQAHSPAADTEVSLPHLLFERNSEWTLEKASGRAWWQRGGEVVPTQESANLFEPFTRAGYHTVLVGYYLPYRRLLGDEIDVIRTRPHVPTGRGWLDGFVSRWLESARFVVGPGRRPFFLESYKSRYSRYWFEIRGEVEREVHSVIDTWPRDTFLFSHWPIPHAPFVFEADGSYRGPFEGGRTDGTSADYARSLANVDRVVGDLVAKLRANGRFDDSLLILTSDHGWKKRDAMPLWVPLIVKWPNQREGMIVEGRFPTLALPGLLEGVARGRRGIGFALRYISEHRDFDG